MQGAFRRLFALQFTSAFAEAFTWNFVFLQATRAGHSEAYIAAFLVVMFGSAALLIPVISRTLDTGRYMVAGLLVRAVALAAVAWAACYGALLVAALFHGAFVVLFWVPYNVLFLRKTTDGNRASWSTALFAMIAVTAALLPLAGGAIIEEWGYPIVAVVGVGMLLVGAWAASRGGWGEPVRFELARSLREGRGVALATLLEGAWQGALWIVMPLGTLRLVDEGTEYGAFLAFLGVMSGVASVLAGRWSDRARDRRPPLVLSSLGLAALMVVTALLDDDLRTWSLAIGLAYFFMYMLMAFTFTLVAELGTTFDDSMGLRELMFNAGRAAGGGLVVVTVLAGAALLVPLATASALVLSMLGVYLVLLRRRAAAQGPRLQT